MTIRQTGWMRDKEGLGVWPHRGKVAIQGWGISPMDRRWDGVSMDKTLGAYAMLACNRAMADAGVTPDQVDGLIVCPLSGDGTGGPAGSWGPTRPYFAPPYDSEDGLSLVTGGWLQKQMPQLKNLRYIPQDVPHVWDEMGMAAQAVADGKCHTTLVVYTMGNLDGRYRRGGPETTSDYAKGAAQWGYPWGMSGGNQFVNTIPIQQYCTQYGTTWDEFLGPFVVNQHRNGLMNDWSFYAEHEPNPLTIEDYVTARPIIWPVRIWDCDRPVNVVTAFVFTTAERAKDMRQKPVYVLNHNQGSQGGPRSSQPVIDDLRQSMGLGARMAYEGSGLSPKDIDIFNPYDGYSGMSPFILEAFAWHGVKAGDAHQLFKGDISIEGPHPFSSGGGNLGNGRSRTALFIDGIDQLRGTAGKRQVKVKAETAMCAYTFFGNLSSLCLSSSPD